MVLYQLLVDSLLTLRLTENFILNVFIIVDKQVGKIHDFTEVTNLLSIEVK